MSASDTVNRLELRWTNLVCGNFPCTVWSQFNLYLKDRETTNKTRKFLLEILGVPDALCQITRPMLPLLSKYCSVTVLVGMQSERDKKKQLHRAQTAQALNRMKKRWEWRMRKKKRVARVVSSRSSDSSNRSSSSSSSEMCSRSKSSSRGNRSISNSWSGSSTC